MLIVRSDFVLRTVNVIVTKLVLSYTRLIILGVVIMIQRLTYGGWMGGRVLLEVIDMFK